MTGRGRSAGDHRDHHRVRRHRHAGPEQALAEFKDLSGFGDALDALEDNPLPGVIVVEPEADLTSQQLQVMAETFGALTGVDLAQLDVEWVKRLHAILQIIRRSVTALAVLLSLAVLLVVGNTIRLDIQNRYQEIIVTKLIGATGSFIRRPFLYGGVWYGLLGGIISWLIVELGYLAISGPLQRLNLLYQSEMTLNTFSFTDFIVLIASSTLLGLAGSWIAVARHLNQIEPS